MTHDCSYSKRLDAKPDHSVMGNLLSDGTKMRNKPFSNTAVDYFAPNIVKLSRQERSNAANSKK